MSESREIVGFEAAQDDGFYPLVRTEANPPAEDLNTLRSLATLEEKDSQVKLASSDLYLTRLSLAPGCPEAETMPEAVEYLTAEQEQFGRALAIVDRRSGRVMKVLNEHDIVQMPRQVREGGHLVNVGFRLNPQLESKLTLHVHDRGREIRAMERLGQSPNTQIVQRVGRRDFAESLSRISPQQILASVGGSAAAFLHCFRLETGFFEEDEGELAWGSWVVQMQDLLTVSARFGYTNTATATIARGWLGSIAAFLLKGQESGISNGVGIVSGTHTQVQLNWLFRVPDLGGYVTIPAQAGTIEVAPSFGLRHTDISDRWSLEASLRFRVRLDQPIGIKHVLPEATVVSKWEQ